MNDISSILHILDEEENFVFFHEKSFISHFFGEEYLVKVQMYKKPTLRRRMSEFYRRMDKGV